MELPRQWDANNGVPIVAAITKRIGTLDARRQKEERSSIMVFCWVVLVLILLLPPDANGFVLLPTLSSFLSESSRQIPIFQSAVKADQSAQDSSVLEYSVERVRSRDRALDVFLFRNWSAPLEEYLVEHPDLSEQEGIQQLTRMCNDQGQSIMLTGGELVRIIAVADHDLAKRTHGVIATVDAYQEAAVDKGVTVELKNLRVDEGFRRRGIARALVEAVKDYAREVGNERMTTVHLAIELDNVGAIKLYKSQGFQQDPTEERRLLWKT